MRVEKEGSYGPIANLVLFLFWHFKMLFAIQERIFQVCVSLLAV